MTETNYSTVSDIVDLAKARHGIDVSPRVVSDLLYQRRVDVGRCPIVGGRRLIPRDYVDVIIEALLDQIRTKGGA